MVSSLRVNFVRPLLTAACLSAGAVSLATPALAQTQSLKLYYLHTGEKATITYKKNGRYIASGLKKVNWHLRDWRRNEPTKMDPKLLDLVWEAYRQSGAKGYIHVISGYRSPASNNLLRKRGRGVAKNSQHTKGKALDFFLPGVKLSKLRKIGLKMEVGGVGYYPKSGSPFVHLDTGNVRHWPKMSRRQLAAVFPDGKTMHIPSDGKPLAKYKQAVASYKRRAAKGALVPKPGKGQSSKNFFQRLAALNKDDEGDKIDNASASTPRAVKTTKKVPAPKPAPVEEPVIAARETEFAVLPASVPIPTLAPRGIIADQGTQIQIASAEPTPAPVEDPLVTAADETLEPVEAAEEETTTLASLNIPIPARPPRSAVEPVVIEPVENGALQTAFNDVVDQPAGNTENQGETAQNVLALSDPKSNDPIFGNTQTAALTPQEIEDLRSQARPTTTAIAFTAPRPAADIPSVETSIAPATAPVKDKTNEIVIAALEPTVSEIVRTTVPVPAPNPIVENSQAQTNVETAKLEPTTPSVPAQPVALEPGTQTTGKLVLPTQNPLVSEEASQQLVAETKAPASTEVSDLVVASLPVPVRSPRLAINNVNVQPVAIEAPVENTVAVASAEPQKPTLAARTISLDKLSAPQENASTLGQWALANETTIRQLAEVQAPAYGRNVIRQVPNSILVQGFDLQAYGPGQNNFKGKAVTAMRFARLQLTN